MTGSAVPGSGPALRYDAWFESAWGRFAWRIETSAVLAAPGPLAGRRVADIGIWMFECCYVMHPLHWRPRVSKGP